MWFLIIVFILIVISCFILFTKIGENGQEHDCIHANDCPASIRCNDEKNMKCFHKGFKEYKELFKKEEKKEIFELFILIFIVLCVVYIIFI